MDEFGNGDHEECSFVSARDADKTRLHHYSEKEIEMK